MKRRHSPIRTGARNSLTTAKVMQGKHVCMSSDEGVVVFA